MFDAPEKLEIEITTKCTLYCHACARTLDKNQTTSEWKHGQLSLDSIERTVSMPSVNTVILSGAFGDPIYHTEFVDVVRLIKRYGKRIHMDTNGSYRSKEWWEDVAAAFAPGDNITFSIDGLPGNDLYRENSDWESIKIGIETMVAKSQCNTTWKWILWKYNQNDVLKGYELSKSLGVKNFEVVRSGRTGTNRIEFEPTRNYDEVIEELRQAGNR